MENGGIAIQSESDKNWQPPQFNIQVQDGKDGESGETGEAGETGAIGEEGQ